MDTILLNLEIKISKKIDLLDLISSDWVDKDLLIEAINNENMDYVNDIIINLIGDISNLFPEEVDSFIEPISKENVEIEIIKEDLL